MVKKNFTQMFDLLCIMIRQNRFIPSEILAHVSQQIHLDFGAFISPIFIFDVSFYLWDLEICVMFLMVF